MEPDQSSKEDIAPLRERLLRDFGTNKVLCRPDTASGLMPNTGEDDTAVTTDNVNPSDKIRSGDKFEFGGRFSKVKENAQQSWSRKGKLVMSKNGLVKSKVKGIGRRGIMDIPQGRRGTDSSGTSSSGQDKDDDADDASSTHQRKRDASKSPVFGKVRSPDLAMNRKRTRGLPRSFDWEDNIPDILGEDKTRTGCDKRKSHDHKDGAQHYRRRNGLCISSNRHQSKEGKGHDLNISDHKFRDREQQAAGVFHSELGLGSIRYDPRFYPNLEEEGRKHGHRHSDSRHFTEMEKRRQQRKYEPKDTERENMTSSREQLDPKSTLRYNKFLAKKHKLEQKKADGDSSKMSSGSAGVILNQDLQPKRFYSERKSNLKLNSHHLRDKPSASSLKENRNDGQNDLVTSSSKLDGGEVDTASDLRDRRQTEQRNQKPTSDSTQHSIESISHIAATDSPLDHDSDRTPLDLSLTINSQGSRRTSKRRKVHPVAPEAVISDDEDDREVILDGMTFVDTPLGGTEGANVDLAVSRRLSTMRRKMMMMQ
ncbi:hypothetical protein BSL78_16096 [Apostichopus japonicus]|uniref:Uncharacterized protein n=1 Tax=Stichopus japonicus TaxID=307972 RepID=A0A2G8KGB8_STIJA|nr:hypothetical protein BSL78_16096 [Apostichopus japonicus]